jgi:hypothetical protein
MNQADPFTLEGEEEAQLLALACETDRMTIAQFLSLSAQTQMFYARGRGLDTEALTRAVNFIRFTMLWNAMPTPVATKH